MTRQYPEPVRRVTLTATVSQYCNAVSLFKEAGSVVAREACESTARVRVGQVITSEQHTLPFATSSCSTTTVAATAAAASTAAASAAAASAAAATAAAIAVVTATVEEQ
jgi:hypothetical protein